MSNFDTDAYTGNEVLQGIVSGGSRKCANPLQPNFYTRVSMYCDWLATQTQDDVTC